MTEFKVLYVPSVAPDLPQCEAFRKTTYANDTESTDLQCKWSARFDINGKLLCSKHAGKELLRLEIEKHENQDYRS